MKTGKSDEAHEYNGGNGGSVGPDGVPAKGCATVRINGREQISCNWRQMALPTCPEPGENVFMPANCVIKVQHLILL